MELKVTRDKNAQRNTMLLSFE